jgi:hypothetical protein
LAQFRQHCPFAQKKHGTKDISDFRPISFIHGFAKIISKLLAIMLGSLMDDLVSKAQSAFIKKKSIHDNFLYVEKLATRLHKSKTPGSPFQARYPEGF